MRLTDDEAGSDVILVGLTRHPAALHLAQLLRTEGFKTHDAGGPEEAPALLSETRRATIVVYSPGSPTAARSVIEQVQAAHRATPVVVLVDHSDFGDYYELMTHGATEYFEIDEPAEVILRGVAWAAHARAS